MPFFAEPHLAARIFRATLIPLPLFFGASGAQAVQVCELNGQSVSPAIGSTTAV